MYKSTLGILALGIAGALAFGCSSDDSSSTGTKADYQKQCERLCAKAETCDQQCPVDCTVIPSGVTKCNFSQVKAKVDSCASGACDNLYDCISDIAEICPAVNDEEEPGTGGASGSGGSSNTGGKTSGTGGSVGPGTGGGTSGGDCGACVKAEACCRGLAEYVDEDPADCDGLADACDGAGDQQDLVVSQCETIITSGSSLPVPACK